MNHTLRQIALAALAAPLSLLSTPLWAESATPLNADFLEGTHCGPGPEPEDPALRIACFDPNAPGTKLFGVLSVVYDKELRLKCNELNVCVNRPWVKNMYVGLTMDAGNQRVAFTTDYLVGPPSHGTGFWLNEQMLDQARVIIALVKNKVIPHFFSWCAVDGNPTDTCPIFKVKAVSSLQYTAGANSTVNSGGFSTDVTLAAQ